MLRIEIKEGENIEANASIDLANHIQSMTSKPIMDNKVYKCRFKYDVDGHIDISFELKKYQKQS